MISLKSFLSDTRKILWGFSITLLVCLLLSALVPYLESEQMHIKLFQNKLHEKETIIENHIRSLDADLKSISYADLFKDRLSDYESLYEKEGLVLLIYENDSLKFWSDNHIPVENHILKICLDSKIAKLNNGIYEVRKKASGNKTIIGLILIKNTYSFNNDYLQDGFAVGFHLPETTEISDLKSHSNYDITSKEHQYLFTLGKIKHETHLWIDYFQIISFVIFLFFLILLLERICFIWLHSRGFYLYYFVLGLSLSALRIVMIKFGFPEIIYNTDLFSPLVYAHSSIVPSLGDLILHTSLISMYAFGFYKYERNNKKTSTIGFPVVLGFILIYATLIWLSINVVVSLVNDSKINMNVNNVTSLSQYSYMSYVSIGLLLIALYFTGLILISKQKIKKIHPLLSLTVLGLVLVLLSFSFKIPFLYLFIPLLGFGLQQGAEYQIFESSNITKSILFLSIASIFTTLVVRNEIKKSNEQKLKFLAENLAFERDPVAEYLSIDLTVKIPRDSTLINSLIHSSTDQDAFLGRLKQRYFNGYWEKFDISFYAYDSLCNPISKSPGAVFDKYSFFEDLFAHDSLRHFSYLPAEKSPKSGFLLKYDLYKNINNHKKFVAHVFIEADSKYLSDEIGFPILLLDNKVDNQKEYSNFSFAVYKNNQLSKHHGKFIYNSQLDFYNHFKLQHDFFEFNQYKHYRLNTAQGTYLISVKSEGWFQELTFFSYLFSIFSILTLLLLTLTNPIRVLSIRQYTLKNRIQSLPIIMVLVSLIFFGGGTVYYLVNQYEQKNAASLTERMHSVLREVEYNLGDEKNISFSSSDYLTYLLSKFSNIFLTDINFYDPEGNLIALSRPKIIEEGLISAKMNPEAYLHIVINKQAQFINKEQIGNLNYLSAYIPFVNNSNKLMGYLNIPYFAKQTELESEISTLLVTLINIYVFLIVISMLVTLILANKITGPLQMLQQKLANISLGKKNETIEWRNNDEIGSLIIEYNRMIVALAESAERLAKSERESAWREMAKQVAHEIKNPLTPLRLNAQLLQRAFDEKNSQFDEKFKKFTAMLIEQVDTLAQIASEFSNFALMPKPNLVRVNLSEIIQNSITLFRTTTAHEISFNNLSSNNTFEADKEQLLRTFNNLIKNALQAIEEKKDGKVEILLKEEKNYLLVQIADNGKGIKEEQKKMIFVPNYTTKTGGMGLGLAMVKSMLHSIHAEISFSSVENEGSVFEIKFPLPDPQK